MYKLFTFNSEIVGACKIEGTMQVCFNFSDPANTDYQAYLLWLAEGNFPFAADALMPQENGNTFTLSA